MAQVSSSLSKQYPLVAPGKPLGNSLAPRNAAINGYMTSTPATNLPSPGPSTQFKGTNIGGMLKTTPPSSNLTTSQGKNGLITTTPGGGFAGNPADNPLYKPTVTSPSGSNTPPVTTTPTTSSGDGRIFPGETQTNKGYTRIDKGADHSTQVINGQAQNSPNYQAPGNGGLYGQLTTDLANRSSQPGQAYQDQSQQYNEALKNLKDFDLRTNKAVAGEYQRNIPLQFEQGRAQVVANQAAADRGALSNVVTGAATALGAANTQQQIQQQGLTSATSAAAPQGYSPTTTPFNPAEGTFNGGTGAQMDRAVYGANIGVAQDTATRLQNTQTQSDSLNHSFNALNSLATQVNAGGSSPILDGLNRVFKSTIGGQDSPQVAGFKNQLAGIRQMAQDLGLGINIPDNITADQLQTVQKTIQSQIQNKIKADQDALERLKTGGTGSNSGSGGTTYKGYKLPY